MKKVVLVLVLAAFVAGGAFAQTLFSAGGGFMFDGGRRGSVSGGGFDANLNSFGFGGYVFLDATFVELSVGLLMGPYSQRMSGGGLPTVSYSGSFSSMGFSLLGKYPFNIGGGNVFLFPLLGVGYDIVLFVSDADDVDSFDLNTFSIQFGIGADLGINERLFIRTSLLGTWRFAPRYARDMADYLSDSTGINFSASGGFGVTTKIAIGFRF